MGRTSKLKKQCFACGKEYVETNYYNSNSIFFSGFGRIPYCKHCIEKIFQQCCEKYREENNLNPEKKAIKRLCAAFDIFYSDNAYNSAIKQIKERDLNISVFSAYMKQINLTQYKGKNFDTTLLNEEQNAFIAEMPEDATVNIDVEESVVNFFGTGFSEDDYKYLKREYDDWTARHECQTKAQEEVFKRLCFKQLEILKATRKGEDTKDLDATFQKLLDTAKLQPKQNSGDAMSDAQTFGTLIDKWENTRPIPEVEEELKDVDKIGLLIHTFYTGHMAKVLNLPSSLTALYDKFIKKYTVEKQEYSNDSDNEALFNSIFGKKNIDEQDAYTEE